MEVVINITGYWKIWGKYHVHWYLRFIKNFITCFKNKQTCKILNYLVEMVYYMYEVKSNSWKRFAIIKGIEFFKNGKNSSSGR